MSVGPLGFFGSIATSPATQRTSDSDRVAQDASRKQGEIKNEAQAEKAARIGETDGDEHSTNERDADGRRPWEIGSRSKAQEETSQSDQLPPLRQSKDVSGTSGTQLDLTG
jgi:hypothetical protein